MAEKHLRPSEASKSRFAAAPGVESLKPEIIWPEEYRQQEPVVTAPHAAPPATNWPPNLRRKDASRYLLIVHGIPVAPSTLAKWFCVRSDGPKAFSAGRIPLYPVIELDAWAARRLGPLRTSTTDNGQQLAGVGLHP
jgi:hypothetical protein